MARFEPFDWYATPRYYDLVFDADTGSDADFLEALHDRYRGSAGRGRILEPACGSGRLVAEMARRGYEVAGFDASEGMLRFAGRRTAGLMPPPLLEHGRMESFHYRRKFDLAHCLVSTFKYLDSEQAARAHLDCVARSLARGGVYVLGLHLSSYGSRARTRERWVVRDTDGTEVVCNIQTWPPDHLARTEQVRSRLTVTAADGSVRRFETNWTFRTYDARQIVKLVRSVSALEHVATFDFNHDIELPIELDGAQSDNVLVLRRR